MLQLSKFVATLAHSYAHSTFHHRLQLTGPSSRRAVVGSTAEQGAAARALSLHRTSAAARFPVEHCNWADTAVSRISGPLLEPASAPSQRARALARPLGRSGRDAPSVSEGPLLSLLL
jgi:hypothetical protein